MVVRLLLFGLVAHLSTICTRGRILRSGCFTYANFSYVKENRVLQGSVMVTLLNKSPQECEEECIAEFFCKSINIEDGGQRKCELCIENVNDKIANLTLTEKAGWTYKATEYNDPWLGPYCKRFKPCSVGHVCTDTCNCPGYTCHRCTAVKIGIDCLKKIVIEGVALGLEDRSVLDYQMSASTEHHGDHQAYRGRLNFPGRWCVPHGYNNQQQFLRVDFVLRKIITDIAVQGHELGGSWVTTYQLLYTEDRTNWQTYEEDGTIRTFNGSSTSNIAVKQSLLYYIRAFSVKINPRSWFTHICMRIEIYGIDDYLQPPKQTATAVTAYPLGVQTTTIKNHQMSTSSNYKHWERAYQARLHHHTRWSASVNDQNQFIRVDFPTRKIITDVAIQGHHSASLWVTSYQLHYTQDSYAWQPYKISGTIKTFTGANSQNTVARQKLPVSIRAFGIKLNPKGWHQHICMRIELYGIEDPSQPENPTGCYTKSRPLGMASGLLPNEQITASSNAATAWHARLNWYTQWCDLQDANILNEYIQVDLGKKMIVNAVSTQGAYYYDYWVKKYYIGYSDTNNQFSWIMNGTTKMMFSGNIDRNWIVKNEINPPIQARYIRINPREFHGRICFRMEIYGCDM